MGLYLSNPSVANVKTWQFQSEDRTTFLVTYVYKIEGEETPLREDPKVELDLPRLVKVRRSQPSRSSSIAATVGLTYRVRRSGAEWRLGGGLDPRVKPRWLHRD